MTAESRDQPGRTWLVLQHDAPYAEWEFATEVEAVAHAATIGGAGAAIASRDSVCEDEQ